LAVLPPGSVRAMPVPVLTMLAKSLADVWLITHFWLTALVQAGAGIACPRHHRGAVCGHGHAH
jgi:hypothetical protein